MTDKFSILPLPRLLQIVLRQLDKGSVFGIPQALFFEPRPGDSFRLSRYGQLLETPVGVAAGPHTQLAQNILAAWLTGARFIELKTVQTLDELEVSKPCIDMQDEGYNCEWSQELKIEQSFDQYLNAWIIIHILRHRLKQSPAKDGPGVIFNMSVGYDLQGILKDNVQWFFGKMADASTELQNKIESLRSIYPAVESLSISPRISGNVTLSTMHGCPAGEIEAIGAYLLADKKLHTTVKLNPTLLGRERLHEILDKSGFETKVPDLAFAHDLKYPDAVKIIRNLRETAAKHGRSFGIKLTNTLESLNHKEVFGAQEEMMYMSGKALHPISVALAARLQNEFRGQLDISFSGGADAFNVARLVGCGLSPVTVCTDLLKPGGYGRLKQYLDNLSGQPPAEGAAALRNLNDYAAEVLKSPDYKKTGLRDPDIKTGRELGYFDCIHAPCVDSCPTGQGIPDYLYHTSKGAFGKAAEVILQTNPFPHTTGMVCDHLCQTKCTRINYDSPVLIREIKRFVAENYIRGGAAEAVPSPRKQRTAAVIGAGPAGLSCAYFLAKAGLKVDVYESKSRAGGMVSGAIPSFRLTDQAVELDLRSIEKFGVQIHYGQEVDKKLFQKLHKSSGYVFIGTGARKSKKLDLPGMDSEGVLDPLDFLFAVRENKKPRIGNNVVIVGGGNTAMDAARTAYRLTGKNGKVTIVYRRTIKEMPADQGEIQAVMQEGIRIIELASPVSIVPAPPVPATSAADKNLSAAKAADTNPVQATAIAGSAAKAAGTGVPATKVAATVFIRMNLGGKDKSGRPVPLPVPGSEFELKCDTLIPAIGQEIDIDFAQSAQLLTGKNTYKTGLPRVFIGGDALRGASTAINAIGDGRKAAQEIIDDAGIAFNTAEKQTREPQDFMSLTLKKARREKGQTVHETALDNRKNFSLVSATLTEEEARREAARCLLCDEVCSVCTTVCPNLAFHTYPTKPVSYRLQKIVSGKEGVQIVGGSRFELNQKYQILHIADWCNHCGNCTTFCPTAGAPYLEKPHLYLDKASFEQENDGYFLEFERGRPVLLCRRDGQHFRLSLKQGRTLFESRHFTAELEPETLKILQLEVKEKTKFEVDLATAAQMKTILGGALDFFAHE